MIERDCRARIQPRGVVVGCACWLGRGVKGGKGLGRVIMREMGVGARVADRGRGG